MGVTTGHLVETQQAFDAGALPHFQQPEAFMAGYEAFLVLTKAGGAHMGVIARETTSAVTLRAAGNIETRLERSKIKSIQPAPVSVMPQGLDKALTRQQLADLLAFLQAQNGEGWLQPVKLDTGDIRVRDSGIRE